MKNLFSVLCCGLAILFLAACNSVYTAKPAGYYKINFPEKKYQLFDKPGYPYSFEYPAYATVVKDSLFFDQKAENEWWVNVDFPQFGGRMYLSYKQIGVNKFDQLVNDAFTMTNKHNVKANYINDSLMITPNNVHGMFFSVEGNVATANQFFLTDSVTHFLRGALYFDATPNEDSLSVVNRFLVEDMKHLINSFAWKNR
jgi:gliding motility-associated lipoprotein GldD